MAVHDTLVGTVVGIELAAVLWCAISAIAERLCGSALPWRTSRALILDAVFDPVAALYASACWLCGFALQVDCLKLFV